MLLSRRGVQVSILEQTKVFGTVGAGIQLSSNASRVLRDMGLINELMPACTVPDTLEIRNASNGNRTFERPLADAVEAEFGAPYLCVHRADLQALLVKHVEADPNIELHLDTHCADLIEQAGGIRAIARTAGGATRHFQGDVLIGADGIKSMVREHLFGPEKPRFTGCVAWRALIPVEKIGDIGVRNISAIWMGPKAHFVHYMVRGGKMLNFVAVVEQNGWEVESWTEPGRKEELVAAFKGWRHPVEAIVSAADPTSCYKWALFDRKPMPIWSKGRITLLGDACHPTLPFLAQGACMAIEDAAVLTHCLTAAGSVAEAFSRYELARHDRTAEIQETSWKNKTLYHLPWGLALIRDLGTPAMMKILNGRLSRLYGYNALTASGYPV